MAAELRKRLLPFAAGLRLNGYEEMRKAEPELIDWELCEAQDNNRKLVALVRYFEGELGKGFLDADGKVLPEELK